MKKKETIVYAGRLKDNEKLMKSSSGGAFTAISDVFLKNGDAVICSVYDYELKKLTFKLVTSEAERNSARESKYMWSTMGEIFAKSEEWLLLHTDKNIMFIGMRCQTEAFRKYMEIRHLRDRVFLVDLICHGMPSKMVWKDYVNYLENKAGKITEIHFRDKRNGWNKPTAVAIAGKKEYSIQEYLNIYYSGCIYRPSCHECSFAKIRSDSDITVGDFWRIEETMPEFYDPKGCSAFLVHTERGEELFEQIEPVLDYRKSSIEMCWQQNLERPTEASKQRHKFWQDYKRYEMDYIINKYGRERWSIVKKAIRKVKMHLIPGA